MFATLDGAYPIVGHMPEMYRRFPALCMRGEETLGPLFYVEGGPGARQLMVADVEGLSILRDPNASTSFYSEGFGALLSNTLFAFDGPQHRHVRGMMAPPFSPARLKRTNVWPIVAETAQTHITRWMDRSGPFRALAAAKEFALEVIFRVIGVPVTDVGQWRRQFGRYLLAGFPNDSRFKGPVHWVAARARDWLDDRLETLVARLRRDGDDGSLVSAIAHQTGDDGQLLEAELIVPNLRLLVLAGHETTAAALAFNLLHLARSPGHQRRAREEVSDAEDLVTFASDTSRFSFAEKQFRESLRMYPAVHSVIRRLTADVTIELAGSRHLLPADTLVNVPLCHLLRHPAAFSRPNDYDPDRWTQRPRPGSIQTAMFGGGPHFCLGYHIAIAEGTLFNMHLARAMTERALSLTSASPVPEPVYLPLAHPPRSATVEFIS